ncbi:MAG: alpha/beta hydrolase [Candidatus Parabeggiatoa sp. nov. 3]|nr:MAG: alpha/beta hydrolase [Gammaproteobacteria bacterium]
MRCLIFLIVLPLNACTSVFFHPQSHLLKTPAHNNLAYQDIYFHTADMIRLHGWWLPAQNENLGTIVFLHGNAENISTHINSVAWLPAEGFNVFLFDYRGYGLSQGQPDLDGLHQDIEAALSWIRQYQHASPKIILFGQSLGASLAVTSLADSAHREIIQALIIDSGFTRYRDIAREKLAKFWLTWPFQWPLSLLINNRYQPLEAITRINPIPVLIIHGIADQIVPVQHAKRLHAAAKAPKQLWLIPNGKHIQSMNNPAIRQRLLDYLRHIT